MAMLALVVSSWHSPVPTANFVIKLESPLTEATELGIVLGVLIFLPLSFVPFTRGFARLGFQVGGWLSGVALWLTAWGVTYDAWGRLAATVGAVLGGVTVVPMGLVAAVLTAQWMVASSMLVLLVAWAGQSFAAYRLAMLLGQRGSAGTRTPRPPRQPGEPHPVATALFAIGAIVLIGGIIWANLDIQMGWVKVWLGVLHMIHR
jgi:hypothetical protein